MLKIQQDLYKPPNNSKITNNNNNNWIHKTKIELDLPSLICLEEKTCSNESLKKRNSLTQRSFFYGLIVIEWQLSLSFTRG
jgi:hypothetical protein